MMTLHDKIEDIIFAGLVVVGDYVEIQPNTIERIVDLVRRHEEGNGIEQMKNLLKLTKDAQSLIDTDAPAKPQASLETVEALVEALWQLLDDMGSDGLCVCQAAKDQAHAALALAKRDGLIKEGK